MVRDRLKVQTRSQIQRLGVPIEVIDYQAVEQDEYGTTSEKTDDSPYQIPAIPAQQTESMFSAVTGEDVSYDMAFFVTDEDATDIQDKAPTEATESEINYLGVTWDVQTKQQYYSDGVIVLGVSD